MLRIDKEPCKACGICGYVCPRHIPETISQDGEKITIISPERLNLCMKCGQPTCMVFAAQVMEGGRGVEHCPELNEDNRTKLSGYLEGFVFE